MPTPKNEQVEQITQEASDKIRQRNIREGLSEIYQGDDGEMIDVQKLSIRPKRHWWWWLIVIAGYAIALGIVGYVAMYFLNRNTGDEAVELIIEADKQVVTGQEFYYTIKYKNLERQTLNNVTVIVDYPEHFIFLEASPAPVSNNNTWEFSDLASGRSGEIKIKGKILAPQNQQNIILAQLTYQTDSFTSEFKEVASLESIVSDNGLQLDMVADASAMIGEEQRLIIKYKAKEKGYIDNFRLTITPDVPDNIVLLSQQQASNKISEISPWVWQVEGVDKNEQELIIRFKFKDKVATTSSLQLTFDYRYDPTKELMPTAPVELVPTDPANISVDTNEPILPVVVYYTIAKIEQKIEMVKNDLNLNLIVNGSDNGQSVDFGQTLHYSINYSNKGQADMENIAIMAVLDGSLLDWSSLSDSNDGLKKNNTITWTKNQIPQLGSLSPGEKGNIDFTVNIQSSTLARSSNYRGDNKIKSYIQFQIQAEQVTATDSQDNMSNVIINSVNSDLQLQEQVRYFNDDNIAVGNGPIPPKVGETTTVHAYWAIDNTLHDLNNVQISSQLPAYVVWSGKESASLGQIRYDSTTHQVIWDIDYLPTNVRQPQAEFSISVTPIASNKNQIMVLLSGTKIVAKDVSTNDEISRTNSTKTTKLTDDEMIDNDGVIK